VWFSDLEVLDMYWIDKLVDRFWLQTLFADCTVYVFRIWRMWCPVWVLMTLSTLPKSIWRRSPSNYIVLIMLFLQTWCFWIPSSGWQELASVTNRKLKRNWKGRLKGHAWNKIHMCARLKTDLMWYAWCKWS